MHGVETTGLVAVGDLDNLGRAGDVDVGWSVGVACDLNPADHVGVVLVVYNGVVGAGKQQPRADQVLLGVGRDYSCQLSHVAKCTHRCLRSVKALDVLERWRSPVVDLRLVVYHMNACA